LIEKTQSSAGVTTFSSGASNFPVTLLKKKKKKNFFSRNVECIFFLCFFSRKCFFEFTQKI
jgi:hypothetical protein